MTRTRKRIADDAAPQNGTPRPAKLRILRHFAQQAELDRQWYAPKLTLARLLTNNVELPRPLRFSEITLRKLVKLPRVTGNDYSDDDEEQDLRELSRSLAKQDEPRRYSKCGNDFYEWELPMPPRFKNVWGCLLHLGHHKTDRILAKMSHKRIAPMCGKEDSRVVAQAIRYLDWIGVIHILQVGGTKHGETRHTATYHVPPVSALDEDLVRRAIKLVPRTLTRLRPDLQRARKRGTITS
jgi:hypothetical protein